MHLTCRQSIIGASVVVWLEGDVDLASVPTLADALTRAVRQHPGSEITVELSAVGVLDDAGLGVMLGAAGAARREGGDLTVVCPSERLQRRLDLTGFTRAVIVRDRVAP